MGKESLTQRVEFKVVLHGVYLDCCEEWRDTILSEKTVSFYLFIPLRGSWVVIMHTINRDT